MFLDCLTYSLFIPGKNIHLKQSQSLWIRQSSILWYQLQYRNTHIFHIFIAYCYMVRIVYIRKVVVPRCFIYLQLSRLFVECLREYFTKIKIVREYLSWDQEELFDEEKIQHSQISWHCPFNPTWNCFNESSISFFILPEHFLKLFCYVIMLHRRSYVSYALTYIKTSGSRELENFIHSSEPSRHQWVDILIYKSLYSVRPGEVDWQKQLSKISWDSPFKGTVAWDFLVWIFFMNILALAYDYSVNIQFLDFNELKENSILLAAYIDAANKKVFLDDPPIFFGES